MTSVKFLEKSHEKCRLTILPSCATGVMLTCAVGVYRAHRAHANIRELKIADKSKILINFIKLQVLSENVDRLFHRLIPI